jgi:hypothetical protein
MPPAGCAEALDYGNQEGALTAGRLDQPYRRQVMFLGETHQIEHELDNPSAGEDLSMVAVQVVM